MAEGLQELQHTYYISIFNLFFFKKNHNERVFFILFYFKKYKDNYINQK